jgi:hypothetical protein
MNEQELRGLVREAVERHLGHFSPVAGSNKQDPAYVPHDGHASHILLKVAPGSAIDEGACLIEPAVRCNHCGFCQSLGH